MSKAMQRKDIISGAARAAAVLFLLAIIGALSACTFAQLTESASSSESEQEAEPLRKVTVFSFHPTGSALDLELVLQGRGSLSVNREQGTAEGMVNNAVNAATGGLLGPLREP